MISLSADKNVPTDKHAPYDSHFNRHKKACRERVPAGFKYFSSRYS
jgi:hypothetical protein